MKPAYHFVINPAAGGGKGARVWAEIKERLAARRVEFEWSVTRRPGDAEEIAARIPEGVIAVAVGGDGTLSQMLAGLPPGRTLGVIPAGRGNDFAAQRPHLLRPARRAGAAPPRRGAPLRPPRGERAPVSQRGRDRL